jgi:metallophosphoesterase (TIGR00282 family)
VKILFLGDVVGQPGRDAVLRHLPQLIEEHDADFVIVNGENAANGVGITSKIAVRLLAGGVDVITTGNHVWRQKEVYPFLAADDRIVRPANFPAGSPGRGLTCRPSRSGEPVAVVNLMGNLYIDAGLSPFRIAEQVVEEAAALAETIVVDMHAKATSEKVAMGHLLAGRVTAVIGTHTHVQTADDEVLAPGTAYITDVGMCGAHDSVIGVKKEIIIRRFLTEMPAQFEVADTDVRLNGVVVTSEGGRAIDVRRLLLQD